jgi:hypothetical protein
MHSLRHDNHADVGILSAMVECVPVHKHTLFAAALVGRDLMRGPWWLRAMASTVKLLRGWTATTTWFLFLERLGRGYASDIVSNFSSHIVTGKDQSDWRSVGGLNQQEIDTTVMLLRNLLKGIEVHSLYRSILDPSPETREVGIR